MNILNQILLENLFRTKSNSVQQASASYVPDNSIVDAFGKRNAYIFSTANANAHKISYLFTGLSSGERYTFSFYVKKGSMTALRYSAFDRSNNANIMTSSYYTQVGSDWTRIFFTITAPANCTSVEFYMIRDSGSAGTAYICYPQLNTRTLKPYV